MMVSRCSNGASQMIPHSKEKLLAGVEYESQGVRYEAKLVIEDEKEEIVEEPLEEEEEEEEVFSPYVTFQGTVTASEKTSPSSGT